jgi:LCP family protein required for cell wall assembly
MSKKIIFIIFGFVFLVVLSTLYYLLSTSTLSNNFNFVILGLDPRNDSLEKTETTDTIMIARLTPNWHINIVSIPRDLWVYSLNNKVNQIYPNSLKTPDKFFYIQNQFSKLTNLKIERTVIITTQSLIKLTSIVGGVDITLDEGFKDVEYPNPAYVNNPNSKIPMYITVEFKKGPVHLDESNITEFVRSRKSITGGTDIGRIQRQQLLIDALIKKIKSSSFLNNYKNIKALYNFYKNDLITNYSQEDFIIISLHFYPHINDIKINKYTIPTAEYPNTEVIYHPSNFENSQWVFIPKDNNYSDLQLFIAQALSH